MDALSWLNALPPEAARAEFLRCCGCAAWAEAMAASRPFKGLSHLNAVADAAWGALTPDGWKEAFAAHPRIGDKQALKQRWAAGEQAGAAGASDAVIDALAAGNREYEKKFGFLFIVCATGKTAAEMLELLRARLKADPGSEMKTAAAEQAKITRLRLEKLLKEH